MKRKLIGVIHGFVLCSFLQTVRAAEEPILSAIWLNGVDQNKEALLFKERELYYIECEALKGVGLKTDLFDKNSQQKQFCLI